MNLCRDITLAALLGAGFVAGAGVPGTVNADLLNVRLAPELKAPVVVKLRSGDAVDVEKEVGQFYEINAPQKTPVYVSGVYVRNGKTTRTLKMYADMSASSPQLGELPAGTELKVVRETRYGWTQIEPPAGIRLYTAKLYINLTAPLPEETATAAEEAVPEKKADAAVSAEKESAAPATATIVVKDEAAPAPTSATPEAKEEAPAVVAAPEKTENAAAAEAAEVKETPAPATASTTTVSAETTAEKSAAAVGASASSAPAQQAAAETPQEQKTTFTPEYLKELAALGVAPSEGEQKKVTGYVLPLSSTTTDTVQYALLRRDGNRYVTEYFLSSGSLDLEEFVEKTVQFDGVVCKVPDWKTPLFVAVRAEVEK